MPTVPAANPAKDVESANSLIAAASTVAAKGFASKSATTTSHHRPAQAFDFSQGIIMRATGATAAKTARANVLKIIEHMRMNARIHTTMTAITVTIAPPRAPP